MTLLNVSDHGGILVIDSRLIAAELGIEHRSFLKTLDEYQTQIEQAFGFLRFEIAEINGRGRPSRYAYLTEEQSTFVMALSRNTSRVVQCKIDLVKAFSEAKKIIPAQQREIEKLNLELQIAIARQQAASAEQKLLATVQVLEAVSPGLAPLALGKSEAVIERVEVVEHHAAIDSTGKTVADRTGKSRTAVAKSLGMKRAKDLSEWLSSIDREDLLETGVTVITCEYIPMEKLCEIRELWVQHKGTRQKLIGEF
ncbi:MAG: Rha family transcriptional regulator [Cyanobacteria bacterium P01_E01_bin.6]